MSASTDLTFRDPENTAVRHDGHWYRVASPASAQALDALRKSAVYAEWVQRGRLAAFEEVGSDEAAAVLDAFHRRSPRVAVKGSRVFSVEEVEFVSYPWEWSDQLLTVAGQVTLALREDLLTIGLDLKDASAFNVQFRGAEPVFMDLGSVERWRPNPSWNATRQFVEHFVNPLSVAASAEINAADAWRLGRGRGLSSDTARRLLSGRRRLRPSLWLLQRSTTPGGTAPPVETRYRDEAQRDPSLALEATRGLTKRLRRELEALAGKGHETTWSDYGSRAHYDPEQLQRKLGLTRQFLAGGAGRDRLVVDVGGNDGLVAAELVRDGAERVIVLEPDAGALDRLWATVSGDAELARAITPILGDVIDLTPDSGLLGQEFAAFTNRVEPSAVLCQAVLHHLVITQGIPMRSAVEVLAGFGAPLLIEFANEEDPKVELLRSQIPNWAGTYGTDALLDALKDRYDDVRFVGETTPTRPVIEATGLRPAG